MSVDRGDGLHAEHEGETFWFCSTHCRDEFSADPAAFLSP